MEIPTAVTQKKIAEARAIEYQHHPDRHGDPIDTGPQMLWSVIRGIEMYRDAAIKPESDFGRAIASAEQALAQTKVDTFPATWETIRQMDPAVSVIDKSRSQSGKQQIHEIPSSMGIPPRTEVEFHQLANFRGQPDGTVLMNGGIIRSDILKRIIEGQASLKPGFTQDRVLIPFQNPDGSTIVYQTDWGSFATVCEKVGMDVKDLTQVNYRQPPEQNQAPHTPEQKKVPKIPGGYGYDVLSAPDHPCQDRVLLQDLLDSQGRVIGKRYVNIDMSGGSGANAIVQDKLSRVFIPEIRSRNRQSGKEALDALNQAANRDQNPTYGAVLIVDVPNDHNQDITLAQRGDNGAVLWRTEGYEHRRNTQVWGSQAGESSNFKLVNYPDNMANLVKRNAGVGLTGELDDSTAASNIRNTVGGGSTVETRVVTIPRNAGDYLIVGSDGMRPQDILSGSPYSQRANEIMKQLSSGQINESAASKLLTQAARAAGEMDDISIQVIGLN